MTPVLATLVAAAVAAAASVPTAAPFPAVPPAPVLGAHCPDGGGRAIGERIGKGFYIRQELQLASLDKDHRVIGYVYSSSDGNQYIDLTPSDPAERVRLIRADDLPRQGAFLRYCFSEAWTPKWGQIR